MEPNVFSSILIFSLILTIEFFIYKSFSGNIVYLSEGNEGIKSLVSNLKDSGKSKKIILYSLVFFILVSFISSIFYLYFLG